MQHALNRTSMFHRKSYMEMQDGIGDFLQKHAQRRILGRNEVIRLIKRMRDGDKRALDKLFTHNILLVQKVVKQQLGAYQLQHLKESDLFQEGCLGLLTAIEKYDPEQGTALSTYATWWIRQRVRRAIHDKDRLIRIPVHRIEDGVRFYYARESLIAEGHDEPSRELLLERYREMYPNINKGPRASDAIGQLPPHPLSLDAEYYRGMGGDDFKEPHTLYDSALSEEPTAEESVVRQELSDDAVSLLEIAGERNREIVKMSFGLDPYTRAHTYREIGKEFGMSQQRCQQVVEDTLTRLRDFLDPRSHEEREDLEGDFDHERLNTLQEQAGLNDASLVRRSRVSKTTVEALKKGGRQPRSGIIMKLAGALSVPPEALLKPRI